MDRIVSAQNEIALMLERENVIAGNNVYASCTGNLVAVARQIERSATTSSATARANALTDVRAAHLPSMLTPVARLVFFPGLAISCMRFVKRALRESESTFFDCTAFMSTLD